MRHALFVVLAVVGMLPAGLLPVVVTAAQHGLGFTIAKSASLGAVAIVSAAVGALTIALLGVPARWKRLVALALVAIVVIDLASMAVTDFTTLLAMRGLHGFVGGMLTGVGYAGIGRAISPDRLFGLLLAAQFLISGIGIALLPGLVIENGVWSLFAGLASVAALALALVPLMPDIQLTPAAGRRPEYRMPRGKVPRGLFALLLLEAGHTAAGAFMLELGREHDIGMSAVQLIVGVGAMAGVIGASGAAMFGIRWGRARPVLLASAAGLAAGALVLVPTPITFAVGALVGSIAWAWSIPIVLGGCAALDPDRSATIWSSFVAKLGLAAGPLLGALVVSDKNFAPAIILSCLLGLTGALIFLRLERTTQATAS